MTLWIKVIFFGATFSNSYAELSLEEIQQAYDTACSTSKWEIIGSIPIDLNPYPKSMFDIDASASQLSALTKCSEGKLREILVFCVSLNGTKYQNAFEVTPSEYEHTAHMGIANKAGDHSTFVDPGFIGRIDENIWYLHTQFHNQIGSIIFSKVAFDETELKGIMRNVTNEIRVCYNPGTQIIHFHPRTQENGKCDILALKKGTYISRRMQNELIKDYAVKFVAILIFFFFVCSLLFVIMHVKSKDKNKVGCVEMVMRNE